MDNLTSGQCLCGAVTFRIEGDFQGFFLCHCGRCRKDTGSAHAANLFSSTATLTWLSGRDYIREFQLPGTRHVKCFCTECGSALPYAQADGSGIVVPAGSLDTPVGIRPNAHICMSSRAEWDNDLESVDRIDGLPG
ncbi:aldehyde-activating protein [Rhodobacterales bacterium HKCCE4037]|nr:aldehyde-activating protein [Rhodobacterales bacterium HKCCE4037]